MTSTGTATKPREQVGSHIGEPQARPWIYVVLGPLLFFVQMVPFTLNGLGVREAFFVVFLGRFGVDADAALAVGVLFYAVSIAASLPGGFILLWRSLRPAAPAQTTPQ